MGYGLSIVSKLHVTLHSNVNGASRNIPVRGELATTYLLRRARRRTWKSVIFQNIDLDANRCVIDVGVNVGQTLLELKAVHPNSCYYGFEPNPYCVYYVEELIRANEFERCEVNAYALSDAPGAHKLHLNDASLVGAGATLDRKFASLSRALNVAALPFDTVRAGMPSPALIKIDVEGHELAVLRGMRECLIADRPLIICEILAPGKEAVDPPSFVFERNDRVISFVSELGYRVFRIVKSGEFDLAPHLERVDQLARIPYEKSMDLCDYLFIPQEREEIAAATWWPNLS